MKKVLLPFVIILSVLVSNNLFGENNWQQVGPGGEYCALGVSPYNEAYTATDNGEIYLSSNNGKNWVKTGEGLAHTGTVSRFYFNGKSGVFALSGDSKKGHALYYSTDKGMNWSLFMDSDVQLFFSAGTGSVYLSVKDPDKELYVLWHTSDNGQSWKNTKSSAIPFIKMDEDNQGNLYLSTEGTLFRKKSGFGDWDDIYTVSIKDDEKIEGLFVNDKGTIHLVLTRYANGQAYDSYIKNSYTGDQWGEIYRTAKYAKISKYYDYGNMIFFEEAGGKEKKLFRTTDYGKTWDNIYGDNSGLSHLLLCNNKYLIISYNSNKSLMSPDLGKSWEPFIDFTFDESNSSLGPNDYFYCLDDEGIGIMLTGDYGLGWQNPLHSIYDDNIGSIVITEAGYCLAAPESPGGIYISTDKLNTWVNVFPGRFGSGIIKESKIQVNKIMKMDGGLLMALTGAGLYSSSDNGLHWKSIGLNDMDVRYLVMNKIGILYALVYGSKGENHMYVSVDMGKNWQQMNTKGLSFSAFIDDEKGDIYAVHSGGKGIYKSKDNGATWFQAYGTGNYQVTGLMRNDGTIYASTDNGVVLLRESSLKQTLLNKGEITALNKAGANYVYAASGSQIWFSDSLGRDWITVDNSGINDAVNDFDYTQDGMILAATRNSVFMAESILNRFWFVKVVDEDTNAIANKGFVISRVEMPLSYTHKGTVVTDGNGMLMLSKADYPDRSYFRIERGLHQEPAAKPGHSEVAGLWYQIITDNGHFTPGQSLEYTYLWRDEIRYCYVTHTMVAKNFVVSIEWDASEEYLEELENWFRLCSNYLYDVTDGQCYINKIAVYDNKVNWDEADIRFYANNKQWFCARINGVNNASDGHVNIPRAFVGFPDYAADISALPGWLTLYTENTVRGIGHELGHYSFDFYDEYIDTAGNKIRRSYNYGFMDCNWDACDGWGSELSNPLSYPDNTYKNTAQWGRRGSDCFTQFENTYERTYDDIYCPIYQPSERSLSFDPDYMSGPMSDFMNTSIGVGRFMSAIVNDYKHILKTGDFNSYFVDDEGDTLSGAWVWLVKDYEFSPEKIIKQGLTSSNGRAVILGASTGDEIWLNYSGKFTRRFFGYSFTIPEITGAEEKDNDNRILADWHEFKVPPVDGYFPMVNMIQLDENGNIDLNIYMENEFNVLPGISAQVTGNKLVDKKLSHDQQSSTYQAEIDEGLMNEGIVKVNLKDHSDNEFFIMNDYVKEGASPNLIGPSGSMELFIDPVNKAPENFVVLSGDYLTFRNGLTEESERAGMIHSVAEYPKIRGDWQGNNILMIKYTESDLVKEKEEDLRMYRWNENSASWALIGGIVDTSRNEVRAKIVGGGTYAAFVYVESTGINEYGGGKSYFGVTPNPASDMISVSYNMNSTANVSISLFNSIGEVVMALKPGRIENPGIYNENYNISELAPGVYYCVFEAGGVKEIEKLVVTD